MNRKRTLRGAALVEFAMALPFAMTVFIGIGDFSVYFWRQTQMEEVARIAASEIAPEIANLADAAPDALARFSQSLRESAAKASGIDGLNLALTRQYACPLPSGADRNLTAEPQLCPGERVYLRVTGDRAVEPLLAPLRLIGYPKTAFTRHVIRVR